MNALPIRQARLIEQAAQVLDRSGNVLILLQSAPGNETDLVIDSVNDAFCRVFGVAEQEAVGRTLASFAAADNDPGLEEQIAGAVVARRSLQTEMRCRTADGATFWFGLHLMPPLEEQTKFAVLGRDITERRQARTKQKAVQQVLHQAFQCVEAGVVIASADGRIFMTNPWFDRLVGRASGDVLGWAAMDLVAPSAHAATMEARRRAMQQGENYRIESVVLHLDGTELPVYLSSVLAPCLGLGLIRVLTVRQRPGGGPVEPMAPTFQVAGMIRLVGLDEVKARLAERWPALAERVKQTAGHVIAQNLAPGENFSPAQDDGFLICFAGRSEEEALLAAAMIGRQIRQRLFGLDDALEAVQVTAIAGKVEFLDADAKREYDANPAATLERRLNARRHEIEAEARRLLTQTMANASCIVTAVQAEDNGSVVAYCARLPQAAQRNLMVAHASLPASEQAGIDLNTAMLALAAERVHAGALTDPVSTVFVDVDFDVFRSRASTQSYMQACQRLDPVIRQRLFLLLSHLPAGIAASRLFDCVQRLRPFCKGVGICIDDANLTLSDTPFDQVPLIAIDAEKVTGPCSAEKLARLAAAVHGRRRRLLVRQVCDAATASLLWVGGVDLLAMAEP